MFSRSGVKRLSKFRIYHVPPSPLKVYQQLCRPCSKRYSLVFALQRETCNKYRCTHHETSLNLVEGISARPTETGGSWASQHWLTSCSEMAGSSPTASCMGGLWAVQQRGIIHQQTSTEFSWWRCAFRSSHLLTSWDDWKSSVEVAFKAE